MMNPSALMGFDALPTMGSIRPESEFPCLSTTKKVSFMVDSGYRDPKVLAGFFVSPVTPNFQSEYCKGVVGAHHSVNHEILLMESSGANLIPMLDSEHNYLKTSAGNSASSHLCSEGVNSAELGCQRDSADCEAVDVVPAGNSGAPDLRPGAVPAESVCVNRPGIFSGSSSQKPEHSEQAVTPLASVVECVPLGTHGELNHQSPHRNVSTIPRSDAQLGSSMERGADHKGPTWSSVVTKNTLGDKLKPDKY